MKTTNGRTHDRRDRRILCGNRRKCGNRRQSLYNRLSPIDKEKNKKLLCADTFPERMLSRSFLDHLESDEK